MGRNNQDYGKLIEYDPRWTGPLQIKRESTDVGFLISLVVFIALWISVGVYAITTGDIRNIVPSGGGGDKPSIHINVSIIYAMIGFVVLGLTLSFIYLFLLRHHPKALLYTSIGVSCSLMLLSICVCIFAISVVGPGAIGSLAGLPVSVIMLIILIIMVIVYRKKVAIACEVIKEAAKAVFSFPSLLLFPIVPFVLYGIVLCFSGATYTFLATHPQVQKNNNTTPPHFYPLYAINTFGFLWTMNFIYAFTQMVLSGTFATWYWTMDKQRLPSYTMFKFIGISARYHLGTLAFGSLIIAIVASIRLLLNALSKKMRENGDNASAALMSCFSAICEAIEDMIQYINSNAYIMCTIHGTAFIQSAKDAFNLLKRNIMNVLVINSVVNSIIGLGLLLIAAISASATFVYVRNEPDVGVIAASVVIVLFATFLLAFCVFDVIKTAMKTIFLCVLEDYERNDGSNERPYFMTFKLRQLLIQDS